MKTEWVKSVLASCTEEGSRILQILFHAESTPVLGKGGVKPVLSHVYTVCIDVLHGMRTWFLLKIADHVAVSAVHLTQQQEHLES